MARMQRSYFTGAAAIAVGTAKIDPVGPQFKLLGVTCKFSAAPTTSESFVITLDSNLGAAYDVPLYSVDPSVGSLTSIVKTWDDDDAMIFDKGDVITAAYTNTDTRTYGLQIKYKIL